MTNTTGTGTNITVNLPARDPRCPHCGRPVVTDWVQGLEGTYHRRCTEPPDAPITWPGWPGMPIDYTPCVGSTVTPQVDPGAPRA